MAKSLKWFADQAGVIVVPCGPGWGGRYGYTTKDCPNATTCGFKTKLEARQHWAEYTFGEAAAQALFKLLDTTRYAHRRTHGQ